jgi:hypothetical protein
MPSVVQLRETATLVGSHFTKERLQYGLYGLYPKYRVYVEPITAFLGMVGHGLVVSTLQHDRGTLSNKCELHIFLMDIICVEEIRNVYQI